MSNLRIIGLFVGLIGLLATIRVYRGPRWKRLNFILFGFFSIAIIAVSLNPDIVNIAAGMLAIRDVQMGRIITLIIFSNILLWFAVLYYKNKLDRQSHQFDMLIRHLGREKVKPMIGSAFYDCGIIIVIPAYNEAENLKVLLNDIPKEIQGNKINVVVVDDGSTDKTVEVVTEAGCFVLSNGVRRGGGAALRLGYDIAKDTTAQIIVTMDADCQHNPTDISNIVEPLLEDKCDFVIGSRILGHWEKDNRFRFMGLYFFNLVLNLLLKERITDCSSGFRAFKVKLLDSIVLKEDQFHTSELIIDAAKKGARIKEVPITISCRNYGQSKKGNDWKYGLNFARTIIKTWWR